MLFKTCFPNDDGILGSDAVQLSRYISMFRKDLLPPFSGQKSKPSRKTMVHEGIGGQDPELSMSQWKTDCDP
jgi:hypothetical protein